MINKELSEETQEQQYQWLNLRHQVREILTDIGIFNNPLLHDHLLINLLRERLKLSPITSPEKNSPNLFRENLVQVLFDASEKVSGEVFDDDDVLIKSLQKLLSEEPPLSDAEYWRECIHLEIEFKNPQFIGRDPELGVILGVFSGNPLVTENGVRVQNQVGEICLIPFEKAVEAIRIL